MCSMSLQGQMHMHLHLHLQVECLVCTVQSVECSVLPAKDEDLAVETGEVKLKCYLKKLPLKY